MNPNLWPELQRLRRAIQCQRQLPMAEWPVIYVEAYRSLLVVCELVDGTLTARITETT